MKRHDAPLATKKHLAKGGSLNLIQTEESRKVQGRAATTAKVMRSLEPVVLGWKKPA